MSEWWPSRTPTSLKLRLLPSWPCKKVRMRVLSDWKAKSMISYINRKCSLWLEGIPEGFLKSGILAVSSWERSIRCSISRTLVRYWSSLWRSVWPSCFWSFFASSNTKSKRLLSYFSEIAFRLAVSFFSAPKRRSKASLGSCSGGTGWFSDFHAILYW